MTNNDSLDVFGWLKDEIAEVKTNRFHVFDCTSLEKLAGSTNYIKFPPSYLNFVREFGSAKLYRSLDVYLIGICFPPVRLTINNDVVFRFGHYDDALSVFKNDMLHELRESPVFEASGTGLREISSTFHGWLELRHRSARRRYKKDVWKHILDGPVAFDNHERAIVDARRAFRWYVAGISDDGNIIFDIYNGSNLCLPFLTIGIRSKSGDFNGGVWVNTSTILPGQRQQVKVDCYKKLLRPEFVVAYPVPDPQPEDRERYWEFRAPSID